MSLVVCIMMAEIENHSIDIIFFESLMKIIHVLFRIVASSIVDDGKFLRFKSRSTINDGIRFYL